MRFINILVIKQTKYTLFGNITQKHRSYNRKIDLIFPF